MRIYIAGALSSREKNDRNPSQVVADYIQNLNQMCWAAADVRGKGHFPYVPGLDFLLGVVVGTWEEEDYRGIGMSFLGVCDAVYVISRSWGVEQEVARARELGIPVFHFLEEIPNAGGVSG